MAVIVSSTAEEKHTRNIDHQSQHSDWKCLGIMDWDRPDEARQGFVADEKRDHGKDDGAAEACEIAQLASAEAEARVVRIVPGVSVGERGKQQRARVRRHVESVRNQRDRAEQQTAADLRDHHAAAERDHHPGATLILFVTLAEEDVVMRARRYVDHCNQLISDRRGRPRSDCPLLRTAPSHRARAHSHGSGYGPR